jgi:hypothetical protein
MPEIPWGKTAAAFIGTKYYTTGTLAELAFLISRDVREADRWKVYLAGSDLPLLASDDREHMMKSAGIDVLVEAYDREKPKH